MKMTAKQIIILFTFLTLISCNSNHSLKNTDADSNDTVKSIGFFNKNEELYIVNKINADSIDSAGNKWHWVEMKNSKDEKFSSCMSNKDILKIGDSAWVGHNATGEAYVITMKKKDQ